MAAHGKGPREGSSPTGEATGGQIGFPQTPQMAADTCANM